MEKAELDLENTAVHASSRGVITDLRADVGQFAGRELLGSTFLGGCFAIAFWMLLGLSVNLWMFFLWMLLFATFFAGKIYGVTRTPSG